MPPKRVRTPAQKKADAKRARERRARAKQTEADGEAEARARADEAGEPDAESSGTDEEVVVSVRREVTCGACDQTTRHDPSCILIDMPLCLTLNDMYIENVIDNGSKYANALQCPLMFQHKLLPCFKVPRSVILTNNKITWQFLGERAELTMIEPNPRATSSANTDNASVFTIPDPVSEIHHEGSVHTAPTRSASRMTSNATPPPATPPPARTAGDSVSDVGSVAAGPTSQAKGDGVSANETLMTGPQTVSDFQQLLIASASQMGAQIAANMHGSRDLLYKNLTRFEGQKASFPAWRKQVECAFRASGDTDAAFIEKLSFKIGPGVAQYMSSQLGSVLGVRDYLDRLGRNYDEFSDPQFAHTEFMKYNQALGTTITEHHDRLMQLLRGMEKSMDTTDRIVLSGYITSLNTKALRGKLLAKMMSSRDKGRELRLQDLVDAAKRFHEIQDLNKDNDTPMAAVATPVTDSTPVSEPSKPAKVEVNAASAAPNNNNKRPKPDKSGGRKYGKKYDNNANCKIHESIGHATEDCGEYKVDVCKYCKKRVGRGEPMVAHVEQCGVGRCTNCGRRGHRSTSCRPNDKKYSTALHRITAELNRLRLREQTQNPAATPPVTAAPAMAAPPPPPYYYPYPPPYNPYAPPPQATAPPPPAATQPQAFPAAPQPVPPPQPTATGTSQTEQTRQ